MLFSTTVMAQIVEPFQQMEHSLLGLITRLSKKEVWQSLATLLVVGQQLLTELALCMPTHLVLLLILQLHITVLET